MTIRTWFMIVALAVGGSATSPSTETSSLCPPGRVCKIAGNCWINGVWYNPCPEDAPSDPMPLPLPENESPSY
jgi:hypothetical protein